MLTVLPAGWILLDIAKFSSFLPLDKRHMPDNLWKMSVTYLLEDANFPVGGFIYYIA